MALLIKARVLFSFISDVKIGEFLSTAVGGSGLGGLRVVRLGPAAHRRRRLR